MKLALIGGSLLKHIEGLSKISEEQIKTPFGQPSDNFITGTINDIEVVYLNRHGVSHHIAPHQIDYKANMFALKVLEVTHIIAFTAVGGITEKMSPMKWVIPDQLIDYTHGRMQTYNNGEDQEVHHIDFTYPFDEQLRQKIIHALQAESCDFEQAGTYGVTQGPRLETAAEIKRMRRDGCDIVGMTAMPEACLARELEMDYAQLSYVVNWAAGADPKLNHDAQRVHDAISMEEIRTYIEKGNQQGERILQRLISQLK